MRTKHWVLAGTIGVLASNSCASRREPSALVETKVGALTSCVSGQPCTLTIPVPQGLTPQDVVLTGTTQLKVDDRAQVRTTTGFGTVAGLGSGGVETGVSSRVGNIWSAGPVFLRSNAVVNGSIRTAGPVTRQTGVVVTGSTTTQPVPTDTSRRVSITFPTGVTPITLQSGQSQSPLPGAYGAVVVNSGATLSLSAGIYRFTSLQVEPQGNLRLDEAGGAVFIYVQDTLLFKGNQVQVNGDGRVFVGVFGSDAVSLQAPFRGTVVAPSAALQLTTQAAGFAGAFIGSTLELFPDTTVTGIGAVVPEQPGTGVTPTLKCVAQLNSTTLGAVFGYTNTTGANVKVGVGPNNRFSPGDEDRGQPLLFVPGQVPVATFQTFAPGSQLSYKIGSQTVVASGASPACSAALTGTLKQLFVENATTAAARAQLVAIISDPRFPNWINTAKSSFGPQLTPFQSAMLDAGLLVAANADLLGDPATLTPAQRVRGTAFRAALFANPAITELRLHGDAMRAGPGATCKAIAGLNGNQPMQPVPPMRPQVGSLFERMSNYNALSTVVTSKATVAAVATGAQSEALMAVPGLTLAGFDSLPMLKDLELSGALPTGLLSVIGGVVGGAIIGGVIGGAYGGVYGAVAGAVVGGIIGGVACGLGWDLCDMIFGDTCQACTGGASDTVQCPTPEPKPGEPTPPPSICVNGCCSAGSVPTVTISFLTGVQCPNAVTRCQRDFDCGSGNVCVQNCCVDKQAFTGQCTGTPLACSSAEDCDPGNNCIYGCCVGRCGFNIQTCSSIDPPNQCGGEPLACAPGETCSANGCCGIVVP